MHNFRPIIIEEVDRMGNPIKLTACNTSFRARKFEHIEHGFLKTVSMIGKPCLIMVEPFIPGVHD